MENLAEQIWHTYYTRPTIRLTQEIERSRIEPRRKHRRRRIQKKWLKRYGTIRVPVTHSEPLYSPQDLSAYARRVVATYENYPTRSEHRIAIAPERMMRIEMTPPDRPLPVEIKTYQLQAVACRHEVAPDVYLRFGESVIADLRQRMSAQAFDYFKEHLY